MTFKISTMELVPNRFGKNDILISKIQVMDDNGKHIKFAKLNDALLQALMDKGEILIRDPKK